MKCVVRLCASVGSLPPPPAPEPSFLRSLWKLKLRTTVTLPLRLFFVFEPFFHARAEHGLDAHPDVRTSRHVTLFPPNTANSWSQGLSGNDGVVSPPTTGGTSHQTQPLPFTTVQARRQTSGRIRTKTAVRFVGSQFKQQPFSQKRDLSPLLQLLVVLIAAGVFCGLFRE